jgi:hypothetical protein
LFLNDNLLTHVKLLEGVQALGLHWLAVERNPLVEVAFPAGIRTLSPSVDQLRQGGTRVTVSPVLREPFRAGNGDFQFKLFAEEGPVSVWRSNDGRDWDRIRDMTVAMPQWMGVIFTDPAPAGGGHVLYRVRQP